MISNLILFSILKVTCALDESCIAPKLSHIYGSTLNWIFGCGICGCHRFDQDALSIANSFFFGMPKNSDEYLPAYALTKEESTSFEVRRRTVKRYVADQFKILF